MLRRDALIVIRAVVALGIVVLGLAVLTVWELTFFRITTFDHDFTGLVCGSPWNNPGWETGTPCHGAVNRQTGFGLLVLGVGVIATLAASAELVGRFRRLRGDRSHEDRP